jgi:hypothetical protein
MLMAAWRFKKQGKAGAKLVILEMGNSCQAPESSKITVTGRKGRKIVFGLVSSRYPENCYSEISDPGNLGSTTPGTGTFTSLRCQSFSGTRCADAYPGADWGAKVIAAMADLPAGVELSMHAR